MNIEAFVTKAFTQDPEKGNPAGVILDASNLTHSQMLAVAAVLGFSESAFVLPSDKAGFKVRFFTPKQEVPLCGHGTIATFFTLFHEGKITIDAEDVVTSQETSAGVLKVICRKNGLIIMEQTKPVFYDTVFDKNEIAKLLRISLDDLEDLPIQLVSTGSPKLMVPVRSLSVLEKIDPDLEAMKNFCANSEVRGFYPFTSETREGSDFYARQFNPFAGIDEDPITGVAAGALGAYVVKHNIKDKREFVIEQGYLLNKDGKMYVKIEGDRVAVGGYAVIAEKRQINL